ncbi:hypothetical protein ACWENA_09855 [Streptomyces sp. NPDC004779]
MCRASSLSPFQSAASAIRFIFPRALRSSAPGYDKFAVRYDTTVLIAAINEWL